jgi:hypothetical protein
VTRKTAVVAVCLLAALVLAGGVLRYATGAGASPNHVHTPPQHPSPSPARALSATSSTPPPVRAESDVSWSLLRAPLGVLAVFAATVAVAGIAARRRR